jgi:hypothetical protein
VHSKLEAIVAAIRYGKVSTVGIAAEDVEADDLNGDPEPVNA